MCRSSVLLEMVLAMICIATAGTVSAAGVEPALNAWVDGSTLEVIHGCEPPFGTWAEKADGVLVEGTARCWSARLAPGDQGENTRVIVEFTVEKSSEAARHLDAMGGYAAAYRWGYYWGENAPGWDVGVPVRWRDPLHCYRVQVSAHRGELALWDSTGGFLQLVSCPMQVGRKHALEVLARGSHFLIKLDGRLVVDYYDRSRPHRSGQVGLAVYQSTVRFDRFEVKQIEPEDGPIPAHKPSLRFVPDGESLMLFDGHEPISRFYKSTRGNKGALYHQQVKLRPGWRPVYYTWYGPGITPGPEHGVLPLVGELPDAFDIQRSGETLEFRFRTDRPGQASADHSCKVRYDADRGVYRYEYASEVAFANTEPYALNGFELIDPLTYNNREPGPEVIRRWNWTEHRWHVFVGPDGRWERYPLIDYLNGYTGQAARWGDMIGFLYPDPEACPAFEVKVEWPQPENRHFDLGLCHWGYDFHHTDRGHEMTIAPGTKRKFAVTLTALPPDEAEGLFGKSQVASKVATSPDRFPNFEPTGGTFAAFSTRQEPTSTMVWESGAIDETVGRQDLASLRIDGPDHAAVRIYQYVVEQHAEHWWIRGWFRADNVGGRGLQMRVKYAYQPKPEDLFYIGGQGTRAWTRFSFVTDVLKQRDCTDLSFELDGPGTVWIDDVAVSALTADQTLTATAFPMPKALVSREDRLIDLTMTEKPGRGVYDASYNGHHLMLSGEPKWIQEQGRGFLRFDGVDDRGAIPLKPALAPKDCRVPMGHIKTLFPLEAFTYELWARPQVPENPNSRVTLFHFRWNPKLFLDAFKPEEGTCRLTWHNDRRGPEDRWKVKEKVKIETRVPIGQWIHIAATHGDGRVMLYINGEPVGQASYEPSTPGFEFFAYTWQYHVGCWYGQKMHYRGDIGPIRLYTDALSAPGVAERFRSGWPAAE